MREEYARHENNTIARAQHILHFDRDDYLDAMRQLMSGPPAQPAVRGTSDAVRR